MYAVGDKVVHPGYGPGIIQSIERRQVIGEAKDYYIIGMPNVDATLMTPVSQAEKVGLRPAISGNTLQSLLQSLAQEPGTLSTDFRERQQAVDERLKEGDIYVAAAVIRDMTWYGHVRNLTRRDEQLKQRAEDLVAGELALVQGITVEEVLDQMRTILAEAIQKQEEG